MGELVKLEQLNWGDKLSGLLHMMWAEQKLCDTAILCRDNTTLRCHKCVVAASSSAMSKVLADLEVKKELTPGKEILVRTNIEKDIWEAVLNFMYTGTAVIKPERMTYLRRVAEKFNITELHDLCAEFEKQKASETDPVALAAEQTGIPMTAMPEPAPMQPAEAFVPPSQNTMPSAVNTQYNPSNVEVTHALEQNIVNLQPNIANVQDITAENSGFIQVPGGFIQDGMQYQVINDGGDSLNTQGAVVLASNGAGVGPQEGTTITIPEIGQDASGNLIYETSIPQQFSGTYQELLTTAESTLATAVSEANLIYTNSSGAIVTETAESVDSVAVQTGSVHREIPTPNSFSSVAEVASVGSEVSFADQNVSLVPSLMHLAASAITAGMSNEMITETPPIEPLINQTQQVEYVQIPTAVPQTTTIEESLVQEIVSTQPVNTTSHTTEAASAAQFVQGSVEYTGQIHSQANQSVLKPHLRLVDKNYMRQKNKRKSTIQEQIDRTLCRICGRRFDTVRENIEHGKCDHPGQRLRVYFCEICDKDFTTAAGLKRHSLKHPIEQIQTEEVVETHTVEDEAAVQGVVEKEVEETNVEEEIVQSNDMADYYVDPQEYAPLLLQPPAKKRRRSGQAVLYDPKANPFQSQFIQALRESQAAEAEVEENVKEVPGAEIHLVPPEVDMNTHHLCEDCGQPEPDVLSLATHMKEVHNRSSYACAVCNAIFHLQSQYEEHEARCGKESPPPESSGSNPRDTFCEKSGEASDSMVASKKDNDEIRSDSATPPPFVTPDDTMSESTLRSNYQSEPSDVEPLSEEDTAQTENVSRKRKRSPSPERGYRCQVCSAVLQDKRSWIRHKMFHIERSERCNICGQRFTTKYFLKKHRYIYHHEFFYKPCTFECKFCSKTLSSENMLDFHTKTAHSELINSFVVDEEDETSELPEETEIQGTSSHTEPDPIPKTLIESVCNTPILQSTVNINKSASGDNIALLDGISDSTINLSERVVVHRVEDVVKSIKDINAIGSVDLGQHVAAVSMMEENMGIDNDINQVLSSEDPFIPPPAAMNG